MSPLERNQSQFPRRHALMCVCLCVFCFVYTLCISLQQVQYVCNQIHTVCSQMGGRRAASLIHKQGSIVSFSCKNSNAFHLVQHRLRDLYKCLYTPCFMYSHTYTTMGIIERVLQQMPSTVYHLNLQKTEAFILKFPHMYFHFWISNVHVRRSL